MNEYSYGIINDFLYSGQISEAIKFYYQCIDGGNFLDNEQNELFNILHDATNCSIVDFRKEIDLEYRIKRKNGDKREESVIKEDIIRQYCKIWSDHIKKDLYSNSRA